MRYFFFILALFLSVGHAITAAAEGTSFLQEMEQKSPQILDLISNETPSDNPLSGNKGIGAWVMTPFGRIRLLCADSGTLDITQSWCVADIRLDSGFVLKIPSLSFVDSQNVDRTEQLLPVELPLTTTDGLTYHQSFAIPFQVFFKHPSQPVTLNAHLQTTYCTEKECKTEAFSSTLSIPNGRNYFTPFTSFIYRSMDFTASPANADEIKIGALSNTSLWIRVNVPKKIERIEFALLDKNTMHNIPYQLISTNITGKDALLILKPARPLLNQEVMILLYTGNFMLTRSEHVKSAPLPSNPPAPVPHQLPWYTWIFFFILSPVFVLLLNTTARNEIEVRRQNAITFLTVMAGILCGIAVYLIFPFWVLIESPLWLGFGTILFLFLALWTYPLTRFGYGILTAIVPFFIFYPLNGLALPTDVSGIVHYFSRLAWVCGLPFLILMFKPRWAVVLSKTASTISSKARQTVFGLDAFIFFYLWMSILF